MDTTCGSVLNVWKRVESYARDGFTALIHGKHYHEETKATASQVRNTRVAATSWCSTWRRRAGLRLHRRPGRPAALEARFARPCLRASTSARDLTRVGLANQTTMLSGESLAIAGEVAEEHQRPLWRGCCRRSTSAPSTRSAPPPRSGRTRCSELLREPLDVMVVVGGYNSSNTCHLAALVDLHGVRRTTSRTPTRSTPAAGRFGISRSAARPGDSSDWLGDSKVIGITAGASTPNNKVGETIARICAAAGLEEELPRCSRA